jgi:hypothetical protein
MEVLMAGVRCAGNALCVAPPGPAVQAACAAAAVSLNLNGARRNP